MNLKPIKANMTEVEYGVGNRILFSYKIPVALYNFESNELFVTNKFWSKTTSRHINQWLSTFDQTIVPQKVDQYSLDNLLNEVI